MSPLLFVLAADLLQTILNKAMHLGLVTSPLQVESCPDFPIVQYADDTLVIMQVDAKQLHCLKALLNTFADATGLKVNYNKSSMIPINVPEEKMEILINTFHCKKESFPIKYLGAPLGLHKPTVEQCFPLVTRLQKKIVGLSTFMTLAGRLLLVKSVLNSLLIYLMGCLDVPVTIKTQAIKYLRHCLWRGPDLEDHRPAMVAWSTVCRPKNQGGLGVIDIFVQNKALLLKNLHKFYNRHNIPWVNLIWESYYSNDSLPGNSWMGSFWWKANLKLLDNYKSLARCNIGDGKSAYFWTDLWHSHCLQDMFPHLFSFVKNKDATVHTILQTEYLEDLFHLPLTVQAFQEFEAMEDICIALRASDTLDCTDTWSYIWGTEQFSVAKAYKVLMGVKVVPQQFNWIWSSSCQPKHKVFFWRLLHDRLNTRNLLRRKSFQLGSYNCAVNNCPQEETLQHLFWTCPFAAQCWDLICPSRQANVSIMEAFLDLKQKLHVPFFMEIVILASWAIWISRNNMIFQAIQPSIQRWKAIFMEELSLLRFRIKKSYAGAYCFWLDNLVL